MTTSCLRETILRYFGEEGLHCDRACEGSTAQSAASEAAPSNSAAQTTTPHAMLHTEFAPSSPPASPDSQHNCGNCSNCDGDIDAIDVTLTARAIMRCVHELRGRYGKGIVADVLRGSTNQKVHEFGLERKKTYGILDESAPLIKEIIELLTAGDYLEISEGRFPLVGLGPRAREAATDEFRLYIKRAKKPDRSASALRNGKMKGAEPPGSAAKPTMLETEEQRELFERLRQLRKRLANEEGVPPYIVFSDAALRSMCAIAPRDENEFLAVSGVGPAKLTRYGAAFLAEINS